MTASVCTTHPAGRSRRWCTARSTGPVTSPSPTMPTQSCMHPPRCGTLSCPCPPDRSTGSNMTRSFHPASLLILKMVQISGCTDQERHLHSRSIKAAMSGEPWTPSSAVHKCVGLQMWPRRITHLLMSLDNHHPSLERSPVCRHAMTCLVL